MKTVIIDLSDSTLEAEVVSRIVKDLRDAGHAIDATNYYNDSVAMISVVAKEIVDVPPQPEIPSEIPAPSEIPTATTMDVSPSPMDIPVAVPSLDAEQLTSPEEMTPVDPFNRECIILSLSTIHAIPCVASNGTTSVLKASKVARIGEFVSFDYCGLSFKYPCISGEVGYTVCNKSPLISDTSIKVALQFTDSRSTYPIILCVCEKMEDELYSIELGSDLSDLITIESGTTTNELPS